ncbi:MAG: M23 family metallopeptidase [Bacteroidota bacterium]
MRNYFEFLHFIAKSQITVLMWRMILGMFMMACAAGSPPSQLEEKEPYVEETSVRPPWQTFFRQHPTYAADGFDFPVGPPSGRGYYNAQPFGRNAHLGDDWNAVTGGNTDLGDPVYTIAHGFVAEAYDAGGGWGHVIRVVHQHPDFTDGFGESLYAHCDTMLVQAGDSVRRGDQIGTIGTAHGAYLAHLHLELRPQAGLPLGGGYSYDTTGYLNPARFIEGHRPQ